eukprot:jgi/Botrbrau1/10380/Bobra.146_2s0018.1
MGLFYGYAMSLFWSPLTGGSAHFHLRFVILLKSCSFAFNALQLRNGYPPPASYQGGRGRQTYVFMRHVNMMGWLGFQIFCAIPFLYELRALLDWSCTATTLTLFDWLKLEDINTSLFFVTCNRSFRQRKRIGDRQPRYIKLFQGALLFLALLVLLWVPLIVFSSGNPTYQVPEVVGFHVNVSVGTDRPAASGGFAETLSFPLFTAGERRQVGLWQPNGSLPGGMSEAYSLSQVKLLCAAQDSDRLWGVSEAGRAALGVALNSTMGDMYLRLEWAVVRDAPLESTHGGPVCRGVHETRLAGATRSQLVEVLQGSEAPRGGDVDNIPQWDGRARRDKSGRARKPGAARPVFGNSVGAPAWCSPTTIM